MSRLMPEGRRFRLFGVTVDALGFDETVSRCEALIEEQRYVQHVVLNAGKVVLMHDDQKLMRIVRDCDLVNADGMSVVWAGRAVGVPFPERVAGIDLMEALLARCALKGWPVFVLGARPEVLADFLREAAARWPGLPVAGSNDGYFDDDERVARAIRESGARVLIVGISSPRKEYFLWEQGGNLGAVFAMGVGGSLDIIAGRSKRAPLWMQRTGLEWAFRLAQEPRRMWRRYAIGNTRFLAIMLKEACRGRSGREVLS